MSKFLRALGFIWALPLTLLCLLYISVFWAIGWYSYHGFERTAFVFRPDHNKVKGPLKTYWDRWGGHAIGCVIVADADPVNKRRWEQLLTHEGQHVIQAMRGGIFWAVAYILNLLFIWWMCPTSNLYYDNPMEVDARRAAGQTIDVTGLKQRMAEKVSSR